MLSTHWYLASYVLSQLVAHLVSVTLLIFTLARVPCTLHQPEDRDRHVLKILVKICLHDLYQPIDRALAAVVALSAPGVASL